MILLLLHLFWCVKNTTARAQGPGLACVCMPSSFTYLVDDVLLLLILDDVLMELLVSDEDEVTGGGGRDGRAGLYGESRDMEGGDELVAEPGLAGLFDFFGLGVLDDEPLPFCCCCACCLHFARRFLNQTYIAIIIIKMGMKQQERENE